MQPSRLILVRHAEAGTGHPVDADRPLTERGELRAEAIGRWLARAGLLPDRVLVSPARRAVQTWERAGTALVPEMAPIVEERIYDNTVEALLTVIRETPEGVRNLAVVGHNPSIRELATALDDGQGSPKARRDVAAGFRTGGVAVFDPAMPFADIAPGTSTLRDFAVPLD